MYKKKEESVIFLLLAMWWDNLYYHNKLIVKYVDSRVIKLIKGTTTKKQLILP